MVYLSRFNKKSLRLESLFQERPAQENMQRLDFGDSNRFNIVFKNSKGTLLITVKHQITLTSGISIWLVKIQNG